MTASTARHPSVRAAFSTLIDYAGLYPPAELSIADAQREYRAARLGPHAWMLGRFILPARLLQTSDAPLQGPFSVIVGRDRDALRGVALQRAAGVAVEALEIGVPSDGVLDALAVLTEDIRAAQVDQLPAYVEIARGQGWTEALPAAMDVLSRSGLGAKLRCGGTTADAFPTVDDVAAFIAAADAAGVPFKATAGLHHPVRHVDRATGFTMHGFLNLIAAAALAARVDLETLRRILAEEDPSAFTFDDASFHWRDERVGIAELERTRREAFVAYGSCSFEEPVDDLAALGLLPPR